MILYAWRLQNDTFTRVAVIDNASSVIWIKRFNGVGEFELYIKASKDLLNLFTGDIFLTRDGSNVAMYVEKIKLTTNEESGDYLTVSGRSAEVILSWRIIQRAVYSSSLTTAERIIRDQISQLLIYNPVIINPNAITWLSLGPENGWQDLITRQYTGKVLLDAIQELCRTFDYGFEFAWTGSGFQINLYKGTDRSFDQNENTFVVFSREFENLGNTEYTRDASNYVTAAMVGGQGEGSNRTVVWVTPENLTGFHRRWIWIDARQSSSENLTSSQYKTMLGEEGKEKLELHKITTTFDGNILDHNNYIYGVDYNLGDKVSIVNEYGIEGNATVTEITEVEDESGYQLIPTLSEWTIVDYETEE